MTDDTSQVLAAVRVALKTARLPDAQAELSPRETSAGFDPIALIEAFARELMPLGGNTYQPRTTAEALTILIELLCSGEGKEILTWDWSELPLAGVEQAVKKAGFTRLDPVLSNDPHTRIRQLALLEHAAVGITGALAAIADTGTLALLSGPTRPRLASLLPSIHIALVKTSALLPSLAAFFAAFPVAAQAASNLVFVTGPSRSADIELILTRGVHGPRQVHVILIPEGEER